MPRRIKSNAHAHSTTKKKSRRHRRWEPDSFNSWTAWKLEECHEWSDSELTAFEQWVGPNRDDDIEDVIDQAVTTINNLIFLLNRFHADGGLSRRYSVTSEQLFAVGMMVATASIAFLSLEEKEKYYWVLAIILGLSSRYTLKQAQSFFYGRRQLEALIKIDHAVEEVNCIPTPRFHTLPKFIFDSSIAHTPAAAEKNIAFIRSKLQFLTFILAELEKIEEWAISDDDYAIRRNQ